MIKQENLRKEMENIVEMKEAYKDKNLHDMNLYGVRDV